jgi:GTPase SAR1 family protein
VKSIDTHYFTLFIFCLFQVAVVLVTMSRSKATAKSVDDVWAKLDQDTTVQSTITDGDGQDMTVLFVGDAGSGKSTLLQSFLKPNITKDPKSTFALEYNFIRKKSAGASKSVSHIWELGGDIFEPKLLEIPLALKNINNASVLICLDLSKPQNLVGSLLKWLSYIKDIVNRRMNEAMEATASKVTRSDVVAANYGAEHPDKLKVNPSFIPIYVVLNKYDIFKNKATIECKMIYQVVRFICHHHGACVVTSSSQEVALRDNFRSLFNNICFAQTKNPLLDTLTPVKLPYEVSADRAMYVRVGKDSFASVFNLSGDQSGVGVHRFFDSSIDVHVYVLPGCLVTVVSML